MKSSEITIEQNIWKHAQALGALLKATEIISLIKLAYKKRDYDSIPHLWTAFFVNYSRPFTNNDKMGMISSKVVPSELNREHEAALTVRDKTFGHEDPNETFVDGDPINRVIFKIDNNEVVLKSRKIIPEENRIEIFGELAQKVHDNIDTKLIEMLGQSKEFESLPNGEYFMDYNESEGKYFRKTNK